ncbi:MAG: hypothetical protein GXP62_20180, partial [Oligoflexia bacterium]|nr:hypothetical protein [Oligoflexia bacterium]
MTLHDLLKRRDHLGWGERHTLEPCLAQPFCVADAPRVPGCAPAVSVRDEHGALWRLHVSRETSDLDTVFVGRAAYSADLATSLILTEVGAFYPDLLRCRPCLSARIVHDTGPAQPPLALDGASFGLSMALAILSFALELPLVPSVAATAALDPDGHLRPVGGLAEKLRTLRDWAPQVQTVLVAADQELPTVSAAVSGAPNLIPIADLGQALPHAFAARSIPELIVRQIQPGALPQVARSLFRLALHNSSTVLSWDNVWELSTYTVRQLARSGSPPDSLWMAQVAQAVAARHTGATDVSWPPDPPRPPATAVSLVLLSHRVQHAADLVQTDWQPLASQARQAALANPGLPGSARLWGALGRLYASWGQGPDALDALRRAWETWRELFQEFQASYAICEWLRILGAMNRPDAADAVDAVLDGPFQAVWDAPQTSQVSRAFLAVAAGRALLWTQRPQRAMHYLAPQPLAYPHVEHARLRLRLQIRPDDDDLAALSGDRLSLLLLRLAQGEDRALAELSADQEEGHEVERILGFVEGEGQR